jgi:hypothetical protein
MPYSVGIMSTEDGTTMTTPELTWPIVQEIRNAYAAGGVSQATLAARYGISAKRLARIIRGETWGIGTNVRGELWDAEQVCEYISGRRGRPFAQATWRDYVSDGRAPAALPWSKPTHKGPARNVWDSADVIDFEDTRPGVGHRVDADGWVAARDGVDGLQFWRGPAESTAVLADAMQWRGEAQVRRATLDDGFVPMRIEGAALLLKATGLPERDRKILRRRAEGAALRAVGAEFGVTGERVRQIERDAITATAVPAEDAGTATGETT